ncbi:MAG: nucleotidyltransferase family protein [Sulfuricurvum sp.]|jgi:hypothetical protein|uniref:nucleotidyltransferase domain-containing protein n=1 Tax=Sulfuricurvum sp. TaxID=2025608 RepID=UPI0025D119D3|nr:nucleotidyltransferase family protein [Sulfuricurvum sp.]MCK9372323.1 nucleotidyltransferase family protein [Sulfuricurvum sp.]
MQYLPHLFSHETLLILYCCQNQTTNKEEEFIRDTALRIHNWDDFIALTLDHRVLPIVYLKLSEIASDIIDADIMERFKKRYTKTVVTNMKMSGELVRLINLLNTHAIDSLPFKGPILADTAYGGINFRQCVDLDIFVKKEDFPRISKLLIREGYTTDIPLIYTQNSAFLKRVCDWGFRNQHNQVYTEIHWNLFPDWFSRDINRLDVWKERRTVTLHNTPMTTMGNEDLLLYLCMHGTKHIWMRLRWIMDVDRFVRKVNDLDWDAIEGKAERVGGKTMLLLGLSLSQTLFSTPLPKSIQFQIESHKKIPILSQSVWKIFNNRNLIENRNHEIYFSIHLHHSLLLKLRALMVMFYPSLPDIRLIHLPTHLQPLYYLIRPFRLLYKYGKMIIRR